VARSLSVATDVKLTGPQASGGYGDYVRQVMHAILAHWYWHYFQHNRWRIAQRTETAEAPGDDVTAWPTQRILDEVDVQFRRALANAKQLQEIPIAQYDALLVAGGVARRHLRRVAGRLPLRSAVTPGPPCHADRSGAVGRRWRQDRRSFDGEGSRVAAV
jgi:hypothetical protein